MLLWVLFSSILITVRCGTVNEMKILRRLVNESTYDKLARPGGELHIEDATNVKVNMYVRNINYLDSNGHEMELQLTFRMYWKDNRLKYDDEEGRIKYIMVPMDEINDMWHPDIFFPNAKETELQSTIYPDAYFRLYPTGNIVTSKRATLKVQCPMGLQYFPFDVQMCSVEIESFGFTADELNFSWKDRATNKSLMVSRNLDERHFTLSKTDLREKVVQLSTARYSRLSLDLYFDRVRGFYLIQFFLPSIAIIVLSWFVFFITSYTTPLKTVLIMVCLASETLLIYLSSNVLPPTSYVMAMDIWNWITMSTIFLEFILILHTGSEEMAKEELAPKTEIGVNPLEPEDEQEDEDRENIEEPEVYAVSQPIDDSVSCPAFCPEFVVNIAKRGPYESGKLVIPALYIFTIVVYFLTYAT